MYLLLSGTPVREPGSATEQLLGAMTRPVPSLGEVATLPRGVVAVVDRALAFDRDARFPDACSMQLAVRAVQDELSLLDARASLPPPSVEPSSPRTPRPEGRYKRPSVPTMRPVAATVTPMPVAGGKPSRSALPLYITFGFAVGMGIVVAARMTVRPFSPTTHAAQTELREGAAAVVGPPSPPVASVASAPSASVTPSASVRRAPSRFPNKAPADPLSRRK
jgi:serine/threonine-protein kinase